MGLTDKDKREQDDLASKLPSWKDHLTEFRKRHPEFNPQEVMKKAGFTFRMKKGIMIKRYLRPKLEKIIEEVLDENHVKEAKI